MKIFNDNEKTELYYAGQAGFILKNALGKMLAVDLYLSNCLEREEGHIGFKRLVPSLIEPSDIEVDYIIATHPHLDHYDIDSMPYLMNNFKSLLFASVDCKVYEKDLGVNLDRVTYVKPGDNYVVDGFQMHFINCDHGKGAPDAVGVIVETDGKRICIVGDTCLRIDWVDEYLSFGKIDVLIGPINGAYGNLNEEEYLELSERIKPSISIPCHYGVCASHGGNPGLFYEKSKEKKCNVLLMALGEVIEV